jgi:preprotein translocase subunit Sss1
MGEVIPFESDSPESWTVVDALKRAIEAVESGDFPANKVYVAMCKEPVDGELTASVYYTLAGMQFVEAVGWLEIHKSILMSQPD